MTRDDIIRMALEALEKTTANTISQAARIQEAIDSLHERLAQPEQEPVAWRFRETKNKQWSISDDGYYISCKRTSGYIIEPLYTTPPQRKPLTAEEIGLLTTDPRFAHIETPTLAEFARAVIAKVTGEKK